MRIETITSAGDLVAHAGPWGELAERRGDVFDTPEWTLAWLRCFWPGRPLRFLFAWDDERLAGVVPLLDDRDGELGCPRSLTNPVNPHVRRASPLLEDPGVLGPLLDRLDDRRVVLRHLPEGTTADALVELARERGLETHVRAERETPILQLTGDLDTYLRSRSRHVRRELERKRRRLEQSWRVHYAVARTSAELARALTDVWRVERGSWKTAAGTALNATPALGHLYAGFARRCAARGWLRLHVLHLDDHPVAYIYAVALGGTLFALKTSYDEAYRHWSPGAVLFRYAIAGAFDEGLTGIDLLGEESRWKDELANERIRHLDVCVFPPAQLACRWCRSREQHLKPWAREHLPPRARAWLGARFGGGPPG